MHEATKDSEFLDELPASAHLAVHESLQLQLSDTKLSILFSQTPASLSEVYLRSPHYTHVLGRFTQFQLVCPLQLEILETPGR